MVCNTVGGGGVMEGVLLEERLRFYHFYRKDEGRIICNGWNRQLSNPKQVENEISGQTRIILIEKIDVSVAKTQAGG